MRKTTASNVKPEHTRPSTEPTPTSLFTIHDHRLSEARAEQPIQTPKTHRSSAKLAGGLDTIKEGHKSRKHSAGLSAGTSSNRTYNFQDFKLYSEEYEKPEEKAELDADNLTDNVLTSAPLIVIHGSAAMDIPAPTASSRNPINRRYSQISGNAIAKEIVEQVDNDIEGRTFSRPHVVSRIKKMERFAERRNLSSFVKKRLIDSATKRGATVSAC